MVNLRMNTGGRCSFSEAFFLNIRRGEIEIMKYTLGGNTQINVNIDKLRDYRFLKLLNTVSNSDSETEQLEATIKIVSAMLGKDEDKFLDYVASKNGGIADAEVVIKELFKIVSNLQNRNGSIPNLKK